MSLVANTFKQSSDTNAVTTDAIDTTGATLLVVAISGTSAAGTRTLTDSKSNTWTQGAQSNNAFSQIVIFYATNPSSVGSGHTFTAGAAGTYPMAMVLAFSGTDTSQARDQQNSAGATSTTLQPGSVTPGQNGEVLVTALNGGFNGATTYSIDSGFTLTDQAGFLGGKAYGGAIAYLIQGTAAAINPTWTSGISDLLNAGIDTFISTAVAGTTYPQLERGRRGILRGVAMGAH